MPFSKDMIKEMNAQMNLEFESAYVYLSMSSYFEDKGLSGMAKWMRLQYEEEIMHAFKFYDFLLERNARPELKEFSKPPKDWDNVLAVFKNALEHEQLVTASIDKLMDRAVDERDHATRSFLDWFVDEQVEEESNVNSIIDSLNLIDNNPSGLFQFDKDLGTRTLGPSE
ncbi:MAG: ferritin [Candidatus Heimdallarchaeota archaeon]|nr:ferritin [Candidatus Heimdallarchaeota archaeon]